MAASATDGFFRGSVLYEGSISGHDNDMRRRPYHRNCGCPIHNKASSLPNKTAEAACAHVRGDCSKVSYPLRRAWSEGCLTLSSSNTSSSLSSPSSSPTTCTMNTSVGNCRPHHYHRHSLGLLADLEDEED